MTTTVNLRRGGARRSFFASCSETATGGVRRRDCSRSSSPVLRGAWPDSLTAARWQSLPVVR